MRLSKLSFFTLLFFLSSCSSISSLFNKNKDVAEIKLATEMSFKELLSHAKKGDAEAQLELGNCYFEGEEVAKDWNEAVIWYRKAAMQGLAKAQFNLGGCYYNGEGVTRDLNMAAYWYRKAAEQNQHEAQCALGNCYFNGEGVAKDWQQAVQWYLRAAIAGLPEAQYNLAECYYYGHGVKKAYSRAASYYYEAAEQGMADAQSKLNVLISEMTKNTRTYTVKGVSFKMVPVKGGTFLMGAIDKDEDAYDQEKPSHLVTLSDFSIGQTEVTQELWQAVMGSNPSYHKGPKRPVECVSWNDCQEFINKLNSLTGRNFRFPTEAEWEYAASAADYHYNYESALSWTSYDSNDETHDVATKVPNEFGIYDMIGNVFEWCRDSYLNYSPESQTDPVGWDPWGFNWERVIRGGSFCTPQRRCRITYRNGEKYNASSSNFGFRLAL